MKKKKAARPPSKCECEQDKACCLDYHAGYGCTRNAGHKGKHIACGVFAGHNLVSWGNEPSK